METLEWKKYLILFFNPIINILVFSPPLLVIFKKGILIFTINKKMYAVNEKGSNRIYKYTVLVIAIYHNTNQLFVRLC